MAEFNPIKEKPSKLKQIEELGERLSEWQEPNDNQAILFYGHKKRMYPKEGIEIKGEKNYYYYLKRLNETDPKQKIYGDFYRIPKKIAKTLPLKKNLT